MYVFALEKEVLKSFMEPIRILHIVTYMGRGGLETMLMNYYRHIDRSKVQFDFLTHRAFEADYDQEIMALGGKIYHLPRLNPFSLDYRSRLDSFFKEHSEYKIVHCHQDCMSAIPLKYAEKNGVPVRIAHSHNSNEAINLKFPIKLFYKRKIAKYASHLLACSKNAGVWMFGQSASFSILNNAIDAYQFRYNACVRNEVRTELGIGRESLVLGHVGRFLPQKNHTFLIDVFEEVLKQAADAMLILVGEGELRSRIEHICVEKGISDHVLFIGARADVNRLLQAMDVFVFPSLFEGLGVAMIEAQAAGLPCVVSDRVPSAAALIPALVKHLPLGESAVTWSKEILSAANTVVVRRDTFSEIKAAGYDIADNAERLAAFYQNTWNEVDHCS